MGLINPSKTAGGNFGRIRHRLMSYADLISTSGTDKSIYPGQLIVARALPDSYAGTGISSGSLYDANEIIARIGGDLSNGNPIPYSDGLKLIAENVRTLKTDASGNILPRKSASFDLGNSSLKYKDIYLSGTVTSSNGTSSSTISPTDISSVNLTLSGSVKSSLIPDATTRNLGSTSNKWGSLYLNTSIVLGSSTIRGNSAFTYTLPTVTANKVLATDDLATASSKGLLSSTLFSKLNSLTAGTGITYSTSGDSANQIILNIAGDDSLGGVKLGYGTGTANNYPLVLDANSKAYVNVPDASASASGLLTSTLFSKLNGLSAGTGITYSTSDDNAGKIILKKSSTSEIGGVRVYSSDTTTEAVSSSTKGRLYGLGIGKDDKGYVSVPWIEYIQNDTDPGITIGKLSNNQKKLQLNYASTTARGGIRIAGTNSESVATTPGTTANRYYGVGLDKDNKAYVNVPWIRYSASTGLSLSSDNAFSLKVSSNTEIGGIGINSSSNVDTSNTGLSYGLYYLYKNSNDVGVIKGPKFTVDSSGNLTIELAS